jgi:DNA-binding response OmpR family regulator
MIGGMQNRGGDMDRTTKLKLLIVEDEDAILQGLTDLFVFHGYAVDCSRDGREALAMMRHGNYDLVILDVMLPFVDGLTICNEIRRHDRDQPVIMLTAKTTEQDILTGLTLGADDYVSKPFSVRELVLRVEAVLRRSQKLRRQERQFVVADGICIDVDNLLGCRADARGEIPFTRREIDILQYLRRHADRPISREELLVEVWGYTRADVIETRTVDIHMAKLRRKIEADPKNPAYLVTIRGEGYKLLEQPVST